MIKILFVCHGNICRSPMAEYLCKDMLKKHGLEEKVFVASAATSSEEVGNGVYPGTRKILQRCKIDSSEKKSIQLTQADFEKYDYFIGMDAANVRNMERILNHSDKNKICKLLDFTEENRDIADPWYTGDFEETYQDVCKGLEAFFEQVIFPQMKI